MDGNKEQDEEDHFADVWQRMQQRESLAYTKILEDIKAINNRKIMYQAQCIYAEKELELKDNPVLPSDMPIQQEIDELSQKTQALHSVLLNHKLYHENFRNISHKSQMQEVFKTALEQHNPDDDELEDTSGNVVRSILLESNESLEKNSKLAKLASELEDVELEILRKRIKYKKIVNAIKGNWSLVESNFKIHIETAQDTDAIKALRQKVEHREGRIEILISMIEALIMLGNEDWGKDQHSVQLLKICDNFSNSQQTIESMKEEITKLKSLQPAYRNYSMRSFLQREE